MKSSLLIWPTTGIFLVQSGQVGYSAFCIHVGKPPICEKATPGNIDQFAAFKKWRV
jgi:hypothetical protein